MSLFLTITVIFPRPIIDHDESSADPDTSLEAVRAATGMEVEVAADLKKMAQL